MVDFKFLDKIIIYLYEKNGTALTYDDIPHFTKEENRYLSQGLTKLVDDGFADTVGKHQFVISFKGLLELNKSYLFCDKNRPYQRYLFKEKFLGIWTVIKMIVLVLNGLCLLLIAFFTFLYK